MHLRFAPKNGAFWFCNRRRFFARDDRLGAGLGLHGLTLEERDGAAWLLELLPFFFYLWPYGRERLRRLSGRACSGGNVGADPDRLRPGLDGQEKGQGAERDLPEADPVDRVAPEFQRSKTKPPVCQQAQHVQ